MSLQINDVTVSFDGVPALEDASLTLPRGETLAVLGPSGSGKSTLLRAVAGLEALDAGTVRFDGDDLAGVPVHRRGFALMFQDGQLFAHLSVGRNVAYPLRLRGRSGRTSRKAADVRVAELLELVGLGGFADRLPGTLSGGQRQRVALARALACDPRLLLLDEPLSALDRDLRERLALDLRRILRESRTTALMVTHDVDEAYAVADRLAVVRAARIVQSGPLADVDAHPADAEVARQLGFTHVLPAAALAPALAVGPGENLLAAAACIAVRTGAWRVLAPAEPTSAAPGMRAIVVDVRRRAAGPRTLLDVEGVGRIEVAHAEATQSGEMLRVGVDPALTAPIG